MKDLLKCPPPHPQGERQGSGAGGVLDYSRFEKVMVQTPGGVAGGAGGGNHSSVLDKVRLFLCGVTLS
jgi:hypothetical protein